MAWAGLKQHEVFVTGLGPVSALGMGREAFWSGLMAGQTGLTPNPVYADTAFPTKLVGRSPEFRVKDHVPKSYRKAGKVMAADIEIAVAAADLAARDAGLVTPGTDPEGEATYPGERVACHIGAGLIAAELDELTESLATTAVASEAGDGDRVDLKAWGDRGMQTLTPLWMLKYLPNMLACHVTIVHELRGPSNTITCAEASGLLSIGESLRVIQRGQADAGLCGGAECARHPHTVVRQVFLDALTPSSDPQDVKPYSKSATGSAIGEGGGLIVLESGDAQATGRGATRYAKVAGFGASQCVERGDGNRLAQTSGRGVALAIQAALRDAGLEPDAIDAVWAMGLGQSDWDAGEAAALRSVFGDRLPALPVRSLCAHIGNTIAGHGGLLAAAAALTLHHQELPPALNRADPLDGFDAPDPSRLDNILLISPSNGGQNAALILARA